MLYTGTGIAKLTALLKPWWLCIAESFVKCSWLF